MGKAKTTVGTAYQELLPSTSPIQERCIRIQIAQLDQGDAVMQTPVRSK